MDTLKINTKKKAIVLLIRTGLILLALYIINLYIGPIVSLGVFNAGNIFGLGIAGILMGIGIAWTPLTALLQRLWAHSFGKALTALGCVAILCFGTLFFMTLGKVIQHAHYTAEQQTTVIVLGCQIRGSEPSPTLKARARAAVDYLNAHPEAVAIATGGQGPDEDLSEGDCIYHLMTADGIDGSRIYIENASTNTDENIANAKKIIEANGLHAEVAIATSEYHQYRAAMICRKNGLNAASIPSPSSKRAKPTFFTREVFGVWAQWLKAIKS